MERMAWTDDRLDDFAGRVSADMRELRIEMRDTRTELRTEMHSMEASLRGEISELRTIVMRVGGGMLIAQFGMIAALIARG